MEVDATVSLGALVVFTVPTFFVALGACVVGSCNQRHIKQQQREINALRNALYVPQPQYYPLAPQPTAPLMS
jgi:hypothetical protein